jgi:hypothetical protein
MPTWVAGTGWVLTVVQFLYLLVEWARKGPRYEHLRATRDQVRTLRAMCTEAIDNAEVIKTDAGRQWVG